MESTISCIKCTERKIFNLKLNQTIDRYKPKLYNALVNYKSFYGKIIKLRAKRSKVNLLLQSHMGLEMYRTGPTLPLFISKSINTTLYY